MFYIQIGVAALRDSTTGELVNLTIPLYARSGEGVCWEGTCQPDAAGVFAEKFKRYADGVQKLKKRRTT